MTLESQGDWLSHYITEAIARNLCTRPICTTCGAMEFRRGLWRVLSAASGQPYSDRLTRESAIALARTLASMSPAADQHWKREEAVRLSLFDIWYTLGEENAERQLPLLLQGSWTGEVLQRMQEHHRARKEARRRNDPDQVRLRREAEKRERQLRHAQRLEAKKERDRRWREKHQEGPT